MAVRVNKTDGTEHTYEKAVEVRRDGYGDYEFVGQNGKVVATMRRDYIDSTEVVE